MKKNLSAILLSLLAVASLRADLIWYESFNYPDGSISLTGTNLDGSTNWFKHNGNDDAFVTNHRLENAASGSSTTLNRSGDMHRDLCVTSCVYTSAPMVLYASFTVNCGRVPDADGGYFAHFQTGSTSFQGKIFALASTNGLPGTWQLGVSGASSTAASVVFPADLATNTDYQVVIEWDPVTLYATTLWVNPLSSGDTKVTSSDAVATPITATAFSFRQASSMGDWFCSISNLAVATTYDEAATTVWKTDAVAPVVAYQPRNTTNYTGDPASLWVVANGQGLTSLNYQWRKNGANISNPSGNSNVLLFGSATTGDSGNYDVVVTTSSGLSATSSVAYLAITTGPARISVQPTNRTVYFGETAQFSVTAVGTPTITYLWYRNNSALSEDATFAGTTTPTLNVLNVQTNNGTTGTYHCAVSNSLGGVVSSKVALSALPAPTVSIGYLRTLVDPVFFLPTNTTALWTATGIVTTWTNVTTAGNAQFYLEDGTGGIAVYVAGGSTIRPQAGDSVTVTGPLGHFNSLLELNLTTANPAHKVVTNSSGNLLPPGTVLPFSFTNSPAFGGIGNAIQRYQGAVVTFTNVYFPEGFIGTNLFRSGVNHTMTNSAGEVFAFRVDSRVGDIIGKPIPAFAWRVTGPMAFFLTGTATDRSAGYQLLATRYVDIVTNAPLATVGNVVLSAGNPTVTWAAEPFTAYSILRATNVEGPYAPLVSGLTFNTAAGWFTDTNTVPATRFYKITSP